MFSSVKHLMIVSIEL